MDDTSPVTVAAAAEKSDRLQRCLSWVQDCKRAVNELRIDVKAAISNREKCCMVLGAAMAACLALESLVFSGRVDSTKEQQLQRLCAKVTSTVDLAGARVKVYGQQSRLQKYCKFFRKQHTIDKFDAVITQLEEHSDKAWDLADDNTRMPLRRRGMRASFSQGLATTSITGATNSNVFDSAECADNQLFEAPLTRCRLRRGTRHTGVRCMVFIDPEKSTHAGNLGHVWWYIAGAVNGNLYTFNLATSALQELEDARKDPPISTMHHDAQGRVWLGHKGGMVRVWSDSSGAPVTAPLKCFHAEIRAIATDGHGAAWIGSEAGNVKRIELCSKEVSDGKSTLFLEHNLTLRHQPRSRRSSTTFSHAASADMDELVRADSARASADSHPTSEGVPTGTLGVRAHTGPVTAVEAKGSFLFTAGGNQSTAALHQWGQSGTLHRSHKLKDLGVARAVRAMPTLVHVRVPINMTRQRSSNHGLDSIDTSSLSSVETHLPATGSVEAAPSRAFGWQIVTAHENGQIQVWDMTTGVLQPVLRMGEIGASARCLVLCQSLGVFASAHADGKLYLRLLPNLQAGEGQTVTVGDPVKALSPDSTAVIQAHRSGMVTAIDAGSGILTCGVFGSIMWWPEAELRSCLGSANLRLSSEMRGRSLKSGRLSAREDVSQVLRRYFTPSSAALAQATLERMHSSGDLQGFNANATAEADLVTQSTISEPGPSPLGPAPEQGGSSSRGAPTATANGLTSLSQSGPATQQFMAEVSRILDEGTARQETNEEMTGKIAHAASVSTLAMDSQNAGSDGADPGAASPRISWESNRGSEKSAGAASGPMEVPPVLGPGSLPHGSSNPMLSSSPGQTADTTNPASVHTYIDQSAAAQSQYDVQQSPTDSQTGNAAFVPVAPLRKSVSMDRPLRREASQNLQRIHRSVSSSSVAKPHSLPGSLTESEGAAFQRPLGLSAEGNSIGRGSGSSLSSSIFESNQWVIDYNDLTFRKPIGEGSIGRVHLGRWQETDVAIKVLGHVSPQISMPTAASMQSSGNLVALEAGSSGDTSDDDELLDSSMALTIKTLEREVSIMSAIRHPNVVLFMGVCLDPPCMVTEFCARGSMFDVLAKARSSPLLAQQLDWPKRVSMALDAAKGMLQLHSHKPPILHRDLKSPNLLVDKHWRVKIADFNLSRVMEAQAVVSSISANNPRWLAPEVVTDQAYSAAADVYSFGLILWELLTWQLPWQELGPFQIMVAITERQQRPPIPPESELPGGTFPGLPAYLELMEACWHSQPEQRPPFEHCIITLRGLLEQAMAVKSQQRATGQRGGSPKHGSGGSSPFSPTAQGSAPTAPVAAHGAEVSLVARHRPSAPDGLACLEDQKVVGPQLQQQQGQQQIGSVQSGAQSVQQLQSNLLRPAAHPSATLQSAGSQMDHSDRQHPGPTRDVSTASIISNASSTGSLQHQQPAHVRSREAWVALQNVPDSRHQQLPRLSTAEQQAAVRQSLQDPPSDSHRDSQEPTASDGPQQAPVAQPNRSSLQQSGRDFFPGDILSDDSDGLGDLQQASQKALRVWQQVPRGVRPDEMQDIGIDPESASQQPGRSSQQWQRPSFQGQRQDSASSSHMSPFAGFAALRLARTSIDDRQDHRGGHAGSSRSHRPSIEQVVGKDKILKTIPRHIRKSLDADQRPTRKSLESQPPPPASSSGTRNSRDSVSAQIAEEATQRYEQRRQSFLDAQMQQADVTSTIKESPSCSASEMDSTNLDTDRSEDILPAPQEKDSRSSGLSQYSPFASSGLENAPSF